MFCFCGKIDYRNRIKVGAKRENSVLFLIYLFLHDRMIKIQ